MANGLVQYSKDIINDSQASTKTAYSGKKVEDLVKNLGAGNASYVSMLGCYDTAPVTCVKNDIYYNTTDKLLYTATATNTWGTPGKEPEVNTFYLDIADNYIYTYIDSKFEMYGGAGTVNVSSKANNAIQEVTGSINPDEDGLFVEDISDDVNRLILENHYKDDEAYFFATNIDYSKNYQAWAPNTSLINLLTGKRNGKLKVSSDGYITLTGGIWSLSAGAINGGRDAVDIYWKDRAGNILSNRGFVTANDADSDVDSNAVITIEQGEALEVAPLRTTGNTNIETCFSFVKVYRVGIQRIDPLDYINVNKNLEDTPVGHIMAVMSNIAPAHYLKCDGSVYNIADYPKLADHFKTEFGSINYFGGDGTTTFAVPDLNGEFLRGTGTNSHAEQGSGSAVGIHQDATEHVTVGVNNGRQVIVGATNTGSNTWMKEENQDSRIGSNSTNPYTTFSTPGDSTSKWTSFTSRPTNTSVLFVIKYEPTYTATIYGTEVVEELADSVEYDIPINSETRLNDKIILNKPVTDYDYIEVVTDTLFPDGGYAYVETTRIAVKDIVYCTEDDRFSLGLFMNSVNATLAVGGNAQTATISLFLNFYDVNTLRVLEIRCNRLDNGTSWKKRRIKNIRGIKVNSDIISDGNEKITDAEIEAAINDSVTEINK